MANLQQQFTSDGFWGGIRVVEKYLKPHRRLVTVLVAMSLVAALADAFVPLLAGKIFDAVIMLAKNPAAPLVFGFSIIALWFAFRITSDAMNWRIGFHTERLPPHLE